MILVNNYMYINISNVYISLQRIKEKKMTNSRIAGFIGLISGLVAILSVFLVWVAVKVDVGTWEIFSSDTSGWDVFKNGDADYYMIPMIILIIGIIVLIVSIIELAGIKNSVPAKVMGSFVLLLGIACIALTLFYYWEGVIQPVVNSGLGIDTDKAMELYPIGSGIIAGAVAGVLMFISGLLGLASKSSD